MEHLKQIGLEFEDGLPLFFFPSLSHSPPPVHSSDPALSADPCYRPCGLWRELQTPSVRNRSASASLQQHLSSLILFSPPCLCYIAPLPLTMYLLMLCVWIVDALSPCRISRVGWCAFWVFQNVLSHVQRLK